MGSCFGKDEKEQPEINVKVHDVICCKDISSTCCIKPPKKHHHHKHKEIEKN